MGQYHKVVNLDRREYVSPHRIGCGLKLWEQLANSPSTGTALVILLASYSNGQGGGDLKEAAIIGSWRGDRIAFIGDYDNEVTYVVGRPSPTKTHTMKGSEIYGACGGDNKHKQWTDVSDAVCTVIENELDGKFVGDGWREFVQYGKSTQHAMNPDMVISSAGVEVSPKIR